MKTVTTTRDKFIHCPKCESDPPDIEETDYEDAPDHVDENGRRCRKCDWEGDVSELVSLE